MKPNPILQRHEARQLLERYYDGATTDREEQLLRQFLASPEADDATFGADKATMGYLCMSRRHHPSRKRTMKWVAAAAVVTVAVCITWSWPYFGREDCVAYIGGEKYTDTNLVLYQMNETLKDVALGQDDPSVKDQIRHLFNTTDFDK